MATKKSQQYTVMRTFVVTYETSFSAENFEKAVEIGKVLKPDDFSHVIECENPTRLCVLED